MSRSLTKNCRIYVGGYSMGAYIGGFGALAQTYEEHPDVTIQYNIKRTWPGQAVIGCGTVNAYLDNSLPHDILKASNGLSQSVLVALGMEAAPVDGVPCFGGVFSQKSYVATPSDNPISVAIAFENMHATATSSLYSQPWGTLLHASAARTAANTSVGFDNPLAASTAFGGVMRYQVLAGDGGTLSIKTQDASANSDGSFTDLLTSGTINATAGTVGTVVLSPTATVKRYTRWQISLGTAATVTFVLGFFRNYHNA
jgi:hypothetical protein